MLFAHRRLLKYPLIRLKDTGFGVPLIQNHARLCTPSKMGTCKLPEGALELEHRDSNDDEVEDGAEKNAL